MSIGVELGGCGGQQGEVGSSDLDEGRGRGNGEWWSGSKDQHGLVNHHVSGVRQGRKEAPRCHSQFSDSHGQVDGGVTSSENRLQVVGRSTPRSIAFSVKSEVWVK